jgi:two-component system, sensor histidine kinase PdtaS
VEIYFKMTVLPIRWLVFLFALAGSNVQAQGPSEMELLKRIDNSPPDTNQVDLLLQAGRYNLEKPGNDSKDLDSAYSFFEAALELSRKLHADARAIESLKGKGSTFLEIEHFKEGEACFREVTDYYRRLGDKRKEAETWVQLANDLPRSTPPLRDQDIRAYGTARTLYHELHDTLLELKYYKEIGNIYLTGDRLDSAEFVLLKVVEGYKAIHFPDIHYTYHLLSAVYHAKYDMQKTMFYTLALITSLDNSHDSVGMSRLYVIASQNYFQNKMYKESLAAARKEWITLKWPVCAGIRPVYYYSTASFICKVLEIMDSSRQALEFIKQAEKDFPPPNWTSKLLRTIALADAYQAVKDYPHADLVFQRLANELDSAAQQWHTALVNNLWLYNLHLCQYYTRRGMFTKADQRFGSVAAIFRGSLNLDGRLYYEQVSASIDSGMGRYASALQHTIKGRRISDSIFTEEKSKQVQELQVRYETSQKDNDLRLQAASIELLNKQNRLQQSEAEKSGLLRKMMIGGLVFLILLIAIIWNRYRLKQRSNARLQKLLGENEWLMREIHHRVKNNLQVVMSLLNSQTAYMKDPVAISAVMESRHRVQAMSLIHQKLYKSSEVSSVDMDEYVGELVDYLRDSFDSERKVQFDLDVVPITLDVSQAVPVGLILNEAITNSYKYAFGDREYGKITLRLIVDGQGIVHLHIADDGRGLPAAVRFESNDHFGLSLIRGLSGDLDAELEIDRGCGTAYRLSFKALTLF